MQQSKPDHEKKDLADGQGNKADEIENAHAAGDGAFGKGDHLMVPDAEETGDKDNEKLRKEAEKY